MDKIRVCMVVHAYYPLGETRVQREAERLVQHSHKVDVLCLRLPNEPATEVVNGVQVYRLPVRRKLDAGLVHHVREYMAFFLRVVLWFMRHHGSRRYQVVHVHNLPDFLIFAAWWPKLRGARLILDLHDLMPEFFAGRYGRAANSLAVRLLRLQELLSGRFADHVITVSHHWRERLIQNGVPADRCSVLMNVADETIFHPPETPPARSEHPLRLIYHGSVTHRYGLDLVILALAQLRAQDPKMDIHLTIQGSGDAMAELIELADQLDLNQQVTFLWKIIPAEDLPAIILNAHAGVVPYRNDPFTDELVPTKLMEYIALGMPAIASRTTANQAYFDSLVEFFEPGDVAELAHCIQKLYQSPERLNELAEGTKAFNQQYNWTKFGAEYVALVERLSAC